MIAWIGVLLVQDVTSLGATSNGITAASTNQPGFTTEGIENETCVNATPMTLVEDPSGLHWGVGLGTLDTTSDQDWWSFLGNEGQVVTIAIEGPGTPPGTTGSFQCYLYRQDGSQWIGNNTISQHGMIGPVTIPIAGEYRVYVSSQWGYTGDYRMRVSLAAPPMQMENEDNGTAATATPLFLTPGGATGSQTVRVAGYLEYNDTTGDFFALGTMTNGAAINLELTKPGSNSLVGQLTLYREGSWVKNWNEGDPQLSYTIPNGDGGKYYVRARSVNSSFGLLSQYVLNVTVTNDLIRPVITATTLVEEGRTNQNVLDRFTLTFSEDMYAATVNNLANYDLRGAGPNLTFGDDDDIRGYRLASPLYSNGLAVSFVITNGPLQPGHYQFTVTTNLMDRAGNRLAANFVRTFWVVPLPGFTMESRDNDTKDNATPLLLIEDPSGLHWRVGQGSFNTTSDEDWWSFNGNLNQVVTLAIDAPGNPPGTSGYFYCYFYRPDGSQLAANGFEKHGTTGPFVLSTAGEYRVRVSSYYSYVGEYRMRVSVAAPPVQMEGEDNGTVGAASPFLLTPGTAGSQTGRVAGYLEYNDSSGDFFALGTLADGVTINLDLAKPTSSPLIPQVALFREGTWVALGDDGALHLNYTIPSGEGGKYSVRIKAIDSSFELLSQYVLNVTVANDFVRPTVTAVSLGDEGSTNHSVIERFTLTFSEDMYAITVNNLANYDFREAGADEIFGTSDDVRGYRLASPQYSNGLTANFVITNGPLQPGYYRLTVVTNITDRAGNGLASPFVRTFRVAPASGFTMEGRENETFATATPLALIEDPSGLHWRVGQGSFNTTSDEDWWSFNGNLNQVVTLAIDAPGNPPGTSGYFYCYFYRPDGSQLAANGFEKHGTMGPFVLSTAGEYRVRVSSYYSYVGEYRMRVSVAAPTLQMETENNGGVGSANALTLTTGAGGNKSARVAGYIEYSDNDGDYFSLGTLTAGVTVNLDLSKPALSPLVGQLTLFKDGTWVVNGNDGDTHLSYVIPAGGGGQYYARVRSVELSYGLMAQYVLNVNIGSGSTPTITTASTLPAGKAGMTYTYKLLATGGSPPYTWQVVASVLPDGLALESSTGTISGNPITSGTYNFVVQAQGTNGLWAEKSFILSISGSRPPGVHAADYRDPRLVIDGTEANRVLTYWRAGGYHLEVAGWDGYAGGVGNTNGLKHTADVNGDWILDGTEANRVLSYWRAGGYHLDGAGADGFAPGVAGGLQGMAATPAEAFFMVRQNAPATYRPGGALTLKMRLAYDQTPLSVLWRPRLPSGWRLVSASGDGAPEANAREILCTGALPAQQINLELAVEVPPGDGGLKEIQGVVECHFARQANPITATACPRLLMGENGSGFCQITTMERLVNGQVKIHGRAEAGLNFAVEVSNDLVEWKTLATVASENGVLVLTDPGASAEGMRFYRVRHQP